MKKTLLTVAFALLTLFSLSAFIAEDDPITALLKKLEEFVKKAPQEKIYLHLDKPYYAIGDDIWFKAYVVDAKTSAPSTVSNILYVELINDRDAVEKQIKLPMESGITWGDFKLPDSLNEGNYRIRAYTQWMRNAGPDFFFDKTVKIGNSWANKVFIKTNNTLSKEGKSEKVNSVIKFTDSGGKPYANREVAYEVKLNSRVVNKGKGNTNSNGELTILTTNTQPEIYKAGFISAIITLTNQQKVTKIIPLTATSTDVDVQFFPEGGSLVEGLPSKVAVKAIDTRGLGKNISGTIIDNDNNEILKFETSNLGMGSLILNPTAGKTYSAKVKLPDGTEKNIALPKVATSGYVISVNNTDSAKMAIKVFLTADLQNKGDLTLVGQHNGDIYFVTKIPTAKQLVSVSAPKAGMPSGIIQLTLFSQTNQPILERLAFVDNTKDKINIATSDVKQVYNKRENVALSLSTTNNARPTQGSFSVSVTNASAVTPDLENESNILTSLLLTSDLRGYVEKPNYYFLSNDVKRKIELDNLLLTQGYRKIDWQNIVQNQNPVLSFQRERAMKISGTITKGNKPVPNGKVILLSNTGGFFAVDTLSDANGRFTFDQIFFNDSAKFIVQARTGKDNKNVTINLDVAPNQVVTTNKNTGDVELNVNESLMGYLQQSQKYFDEQMKRGFLNRTILLQEIKIVEKKNPAPNSQNLNGPGHADQVITEKDLENAFSLSQYLSGRVAGVQVRGGQAFSSRSAGMGGGGAMAIVLDGMNLGSDFLLDDVVVTDIESVEILKSMSNTAMYGSGGSNGVIVITTKRGKSSSDYNRYAPGIITYNPKGYYKVRQFYSPKYDVTPDDKPDLRTTVYWNPHLVSDNNGKASINYYNTDVAGAYRMVIEGIDAEGNLGRKVYTYQVN